MQSCVSPFIPPPFIFFFAAHIMFIFYSSFPPFHSILWLFGTSRCRWLDGVMDRTTLLPHVSIQHPLVWSHDVSQSTAEKGYKDGKWNGGRRRWEGGRRGKKGLVKRWPLKEKSERHLSSAVDVKAVLTFIRTIKGLVNRRYRTLPTLKFWL